MIRVIVIDDDEQEVSTEWVDVQFLRTDPYRSMTFLSRCNVMISTFIKRQVSKLEVKKP